MDFLGPIDFGKGIEVYPKKMDLVMSWPRSLYPSDIRCFWGLVGCYKRFVEEFSSIACPVTALTK